VQKKKRNHKEWVRKNSRNKKIKKRLTTIDSPHGQIQGISCAGKIANNRYKIKAELKKAKLGGEYSHANSKPLTLFGSSSRNQR
jgi:hypothetical protein